MGLTLKVCCSLYLSLTLWKWRKQIINHWGTFHRFGMSCAQAQGLIFHSSLTHQNAVQSKWTIIHLEGLNVKESACSIPFRNDLNSGHRNAVPAYAASMWSQRPSLTPRWGKKPDVYKDKITQAKMCKLLMIGQLCCFQMVIYLSRSICWL